MPNLEFFFDFSSPFTYLATPRTEQVARDAGATLIWRPMLLGGVFKAIGGPIVPLQHFSPQKQKNQMLDLYRWAEHVDLPFLWPSRFPILTLVPLRVACQLDQDRMSEYANAVFRALWAEDRDIASPDVVGEILSDLGHDADALIAGTRDPAVKRLLIEGTDEAVARGVFGAPTFFVDGDLLFWGQDRLDLVERALKGWRPKHG